VRLHQDGSKSFVRQDGSQKIKHRDGHIAYTDDSGRVNKVVFGGTKISYNTNGSKTISSGNTIINQNISIHNDVTVMQKNYTVHNTFLHHDLVYNHHYEQRHCTSWRSPILFYATELALGVLDYSFFGPHYHHYYRPIWGYSQWNDYSWSDDSWYNYYSSFYWKPYGYWVSDYRPSYSLVDWIFSSTFEYAWQERLEARREAARQENEDRALQAESDEEAARIRALIEEEVQYAVQQALDEAKASIPQTDDTSAPLIDQETQDQFASQIEQISVDRNNNVSIDVGFDNALADTKHLFLVQSNTDKSYDDGNNGQCKLSAGDILQQDSSFDRASNEGLIGLRVKVAHSESCSAGSTIIMTAEDLALIYNALHEQMDVGAKQLAEANQPLVDDDTPVSDYTPVSDDTNEDEL
jgi:hypothetical protein